MTSGSTHVSSIIGRVAGFILMLAAASAIAITPAAAADDKHVPKLRSARDSATIQDVSGLSVTRRWTIAKDDPDTLVTKITVHNTSEAPITTSIIEPIPTTSLKRITFKPLSMRTSSVPGFGRYDVTVPPAGNLSFGYSARLMPQRKVTPQDRLIAVKGEMEATLPIAQPADVDQAVAVVKNHYFGPVERTEAVETGIDGAPPTLGPVGNASLTLTGTPGCLVIGRSCHFTAQDNAPREPKLTALDPAGNVLVATVAADVPNSGFTCGGVEAPAVTVRNWTFEPTAWRLSWAGWQVTKGRYTVVTDTDVAENNRCVAAASHTVVTGLLTG